MLSTLNPLKKKKKKSVNLIQQLATKNIGLKVMYIKYSYQSLNSFHFPHANSKSEFNETINPAK